MSSSFLQKTIELKRESSDGGKTGLRYPLGCFWENTCFEFLINAFPMECWYTKIVTNSSCLFLLLICFDMFWSTDTTQHNSEEARHAKCWRNFQPKRDRSDEPLYCMISMPMWRFSTFPRIYAPRWVRSSRQLDTKTSWIIVGTSLLKSHGKNTSIPPFVLSLMALTKIITKTLTIQHRQIKFVVPFFMLQMEK